jgi:chromosome segregation ATPase
LKSELSQKKLDLADLANRLLAYEAEDKKRQHDILSKDNMTMDLQQKKENLEKQLSESRAEFQAQSTKQKEAIISLESSVAALNAQITVLTTDLATAKQQAEHAKREADDARALLANLEVDQNTQKALLGKTESEEQAIRKRVNQLQQSLDLAVQEKEKLHRQLKEEQEERKRLESRAYSMEQQSVEASSLNEKLEQLRAENTRLRHLEFVIEDNKRKYMLEKSELEGDIARLRGAASRLADMENENEALNKQINETKNRMRDMDNSIMAINNKYKDAEARYQVSSTFN